MEKVKLTNEQIKLASTWIENGNTIQDYVNIKNGSTNYKARKEKYAELLKLNIGEFARAITGQYEKIHEFKNREWVLDKENNEFIKIGTTIHVDTVIEMHDKYEHVSEKWKVAMLEVGRTELELKIGDKLILKDNINRSIETNRSRKELEIKLINGGVKALYLVENAIIF